MKLKKQRLVKYTKILQDFEMVCNNLQHYLSPRGFLLQAYFLYSFTFFLATCFGLSSEFVRLTIHIQSCDYHLFFSKRNYFTLRSAIGFCYEVVWILMPIEDGLRLLISNQYFSLDSKLENVWIISVCGKQTKRTNLPPYYFSS